MGRNRPAIIWQTSGKEFSDKDLADINSLLGELSSHSRVITKTDLARILKSGKIVMVKGSRGIVGMATVCVFHTLNGSVGRIEDVVVAKSHRGLGLGKKLVEELIAFSAINRLRYLELTSAPHRFAANKLYQELGFAPYPSNYYRLYL